MEIVQFFATFVSIILPSLAMYDTQAAVATGKAVPLDYLAWAGVYCLAYTTAAILLAFILFEDRDLA